MQTLAPPCGRPVDSYLIPNETWPKGRVCVMPACTTILSVYNPGPACCAHEERWQVIELYRELARMTMQGRDLRRTRDRFECAQARRGVGVA